MAKILISAAGSEAAVAGPFLLAIMNALRSVLLVLGTALLVGACDTLPSRPAAPVPAARSATRPAAPAPVPEPVESIAQAQAAEPAAFDTENNVYFQPGLAILDERAMAVLERHAERLRQNPRLVVTLSGFTDDLGSRAYNLAVAELRVEAVAKFLLGRGVSRLQLRRVALGNEKTSLMRCRSDPCRQAMRRVQLAYE